MQKKSTKVASQPKILPAAVATNGSVATVKRKQESSDSSESDSSSDEEEVSVGNFTSINVSTPVSWELGHEAVMMMMRKKHIRT